MDTLRLISTLICPETREFDEDERGICFACGAAMVVVVVAICHDLGYFSPLQVAEYYDQLVIKHCRNIGHSLPVSPIGWA